MQLNIVQANVLRPVAAIAASANQTLKSSASGHVFQVRHHVKMYPWRSNRSNPECHLDNTRTPYTDKHNINEFRFIKRQLKPWQKVIPKDKDNRFNQFKWNDAYESDPAKAKSTAHDKLLRFTQSLRDRGEARGRRAYNPPSDVQEKILTAFKSSLSKRSAAEQAGTSEIVANSDDEILSLDLESYRELKFRLIAGCIDIFQHDLPSSYLNDISTIRDVVDYFSTPVRGVNPYENLVSNKDLPPNLSIISEPQRFNKETDERFKGYNALPGTISEVQGLRGRKKYPTLNQDEFQWPDI